MPMLAVLKPNVKVLVFKSTTPAVNVKVPPTLKLFTSIVIPVELLNKRLPKLAVGLVNALRKVPVPPIVCASVEATTDVPLNAARERV
jgi:hypothetical protein